MFRIFKSVAKFVIVLFAMTIVCTVVWQVVVTEYLYDCTDVAANLPAYKAPIPQPVVDCLEQNPEGCPYAAFRQYFEEQARLGGRQVLVTEMEHHADLLPWRHRSGHVMVGLSTDGHIDLDAIEEALKQGGGKIGLVALCGASNVTGFVSPIHEVAEPSSYLRARRGGGEDAPQHLGGRQARGCAHLAPKRVGEFGLQRLHGAEPGK